MAEKRDPNSVRFKETSGLSVTGLFDIDCIKSLNNNKMLSSLEMLRFNYLIINFGWKLRK